MLRKCHLNTCSVGIATQDPELRRRFQGTPEGVVHYFLFVAHEVRELLASLGARTLDEVVGRKDLLRSRTDGEHWKARRLDLGPLLAMPRAAPELPRRCVEVQHKDVSDHLDRSLLLRARSTLQGGPPSLLVAPVRNAHRAVAATPSGEIARDPGSAGLPDDSIRVRLQGSAGQSFGAFLAAGVTLELEGDANDYVGKGLSGGRLIVYPPAGIRFAPEENVIIGNTVLYGATRG